MKEASGPGIDTSGIAKDFGRYLLLLSRGSAMDKGPVPDLRSLVDWKGNRVVYCKSLV